MGAEHTFYIEQQLEPQTINREFFGYTANKYDLYLPYLISSLPETIKVVEDFSWNTEYRISSDNFSTLVAYAKRLSSMSDKEFKKTLPETYLDVYDNIYANAFYKEKREKVAKFLEKIEKNIGNKKNQNWWPAEEYPAVFTDISEFFPHIEDQSNWNLIMTVG